jgi:hypothetical protein
MAARIAGVGWVTVSLLKSMTAMHLSRLRCLGQACQILEPLGEVTTSNPMNCIQGLMR